MVRRLFVEKKSGFDVEAQGLFEDIRTNLHVKNVKAVRILDRYDIDGISDEVFNQTEYAVFAEPPIDNTFLEELPEDVVSAIFFAVELLPGQFDQRADSAETCIKLIMPHANPVVKFAKVIAIYGDISAEDLKKIKVCDVRHPRLVRPESGEVTVHQVGRALFPRRGPDSAR